MDGVNPNSVGMKVKIAGFNASMDEVNATFGGMKASDLEMNAMKVGLHCIHG